MKKLKFLILTFLFVCLSVAAIGCTPTAGGDTTHSFFVSHETAVMEIGDTVKITATYGDEDVAFSSTDDTVATVSADGVVTAKALGEAVIEIRAGDKKRSCKISVVEVEYTVVLDKTGTVHVFVDASLNLTATAFKDDAVYDAVITWRVSGQGANLTLNGNNAVFSCSVKGEYTVTAVTADGAETSVTVCVIDSASDLQ